MEQDIVTQEAFKVLKKDALKKFDHTKKSLSEAVGIDYDNSFFQDGSEGFIEIMRTLVFAKTNSEIMEFCLKRAQSIVEFAELYARMLIIKGDMIKQLKR